MGVGPKYPFRDAFLIKNQNDSVARPRSQDCHCHPEDCHPEDRPRRSRRRSEDHERWYENGRKEIEANYREGTLHGSYTTWDEDGNTTAKGTYTDGSLDPAHGSRSDGATW